MPSAVVFISFRDLILENIGIPFAVVGLAWICGRVVQHLRQPAVIGELAAGIALGPSVFGVLTPASAALVFTPAAVSTISQLAQIAILVFMFFIGSELDISLLRRHLKGVARIASFSLFLPFTLGATLATALFANWHGSTANETAFILFGGTAMAITAMPVLTRILSDMHLLGTPLGTIAIGCAAVDDVVAWTMLGFVVTLVHGETTGAFGVFLVAAYIAAMLVIVRPALARVEIVCGQRAGRIVWLCLVMVTAALSAWLTEEIGIHAVFGALVAGVCMLRTGGALHGLEPVRRLSSVLLPAFFVLIGLRTEVALMSGPSEWLLTVLIIVSATAGKLGGAALAARTLGFAWRESIVIGSLLNTRGMVELVALDIGRTLGILSPALFTMFVIMTFVTTFATVPLLQAIREKPRTLDEIQELQRKY